MHFCGKLLQFWFIICVIICKTESSRILGLFPFFAKSHNYIFEALMKGLATRGHKVDIISHYELEDPPENYRTVINLNGSSYSFTNNIPVNSTEEKYVEKDPPYYFALYGNDNCELLALDKFQKFIKNPPEKYDLVITEALMKGLATRGHKVDIISHYELEDPPDNHRTVINLNGSSDSFTNKIPVNSTEEKFLEKDPSYYFAIFGNYNCELLALDKFQKFIKNPPEKYDLIITESFHASCYYGMGYIFKVPVITVSTMREFPWTFSTLGNSDYTSFVPSLFFKSASVTTFYDRLKNTIMVHLNRNRFNKYTEDPQTKLMRKHLSPNIPNVRELEKKVALMLTYYHYSLFGVKPLTPSIISIAGLHIEENHDVLSSELEEWMNESVEGVVYFSFGSMFLIETLPEDTLLKFYEVFSKISPIRVLMKIPNKEKLPPGLPENVRLDPWLPQVAILRHKNTKMFITHGGLLGVQEAIYFGVPMIGIPIGVDQFLNVNVLVQKNVAIYIDYETLTLENLYTAVKSVLYDPKYKEAALNESRLFRDRPMNAMNTATFWVEYILRNGPESLRSPTLDLEWWQAELLDVYLFILLTCTIIIYLFVFFIQVIINVSCNVGKKSKIPQKRD